MGNRIFHATAYAARKTSVSVLVLTCNEAHNIVACLSCLGFCDDIVVLDSGSTDRTVEIAQQAKHVRVVHRTFDTESSQRNFGLHNIHYRHPWVYVCDADERVPEDLAEEILQASASTLSNHAAYRLRYRFLFERRWIKHASGYPVWITRLVRPERVRYEDRLTHCHPIVDGSVGVLKTHFLHDAMSGGLSRWLRKHNRYSSAEAVEAIRVRLAGRPDLRQLVSRDPCVRRRAMKNLSYFVAGRTGWRLLYACIGCAAWRDGLPGLRYAALIALYEHWISLKIAARDSDLMGLESDRSTQRVAQRIDREITSTEEQSLGTKAKGIRGVMLRERAGRAPAIPYVFRRLMIHMFRQERVRAMWGCPLTLDNRTALGIKELHRKIPEALVPDEEPIPGSECAVGEVAHPGAAIASLR